MRAKIYQFPSPDELNMIPIAVHNFLLTQNSISRRLMLHLIRKILNRYSIHRLQFPDFSVETVKGSYSKIYARRFIQERHCPNCGEPIYPAGSRVRILSIKETPGRHTVTYGCKCGAIFGKHEPV